MNSPLFVAMLLFTSSLASPIAHPDTTFYNEKTFYNHRNPLFHPAGAGKSQIHFASSFGASQEQIGPGIGFGGGFAPHHGGHHREDGYEHRRQTFEQSQGRRYTSIF